MSNSGWKGLQSCRILTRDGATPMVSGMFYKAVVQSILLFGLETWVLIMPLYLRPWRAAIGIGGGCTPDCGQAAVPLSMDR